MHSMAGSTARYQMLFMFPRLMLTRYIVVHQALTHSLLFSLYTPQIKEKESLDYMLHTTKHRPFSPKRESRIVFFNTKYIFLTYHLKWAYEAEISLLIVYEKNSRGWKVKASSVAQHNMLITLIINCNHWADKISYDKLRCNKRNNI